MKEMSDEIDEWFESWIDWTHFYPSIKKTCQLNSDLGRASGLWYKSIMIFERSLKSCVIQQWDWIPTVYVLCKIV